MKLFKFVVGDEERLHPFDDAQEAYDRRTEVDASYHYLPVLITEVSVPGYEIHVYPEVPDAPIEPSNTPDPTSDLAENMDEDTCRAYLDKHQVEYHPQLGLKRLRETVRAHQQQSE